MAKVYQFPTKKRLAPEVEECVKKVAEAYIQILNYALVTLSSEHPTKEELDEIRELVELSYFIGICEAINQLEDES